MSSAPLSHAGGQVGDRRCCSQRPPRFACKGSPSAQQKTKGRIQGSCSEAAGCRDSQSHRQAAGIGRTGAAAGGFLTPHLRRPPPSPHNPVAEWEPDCSPFCLLGWGGMGLNEFRGLLEWPSESNASLKREACDRKSGARQQALAFNDGCERLRTQIPRSSCSLRPNLLCRAPSLGSAASGACCPKRRSDVNLCGAVANSRQGDVSGWRSQARY